jgi:hypothetical protein
MYNTERLDSSRHNRIQSMRVRHVVHANRRFETVTSSTWGPPIWPDVISDMSGSEVRRRLTSSLTSLIHSSNGFCHSAISSAVGAGLAAAPSFGAGLRLGVELSTKSKVSAHSCKVVGLARTKPRPSTSPASCPKQRPIPPCSSPKHTRRPWPPRPSTADG